MSKFEFNRCVVVVNPAASNYDRGQRFIRQLADQLPEGHMEIIEMRHTDYERPSWLITRLNSAIDNRTLLVIAGGDGTVNLVIDTLLRSSAISPAARKVVILPLWAGNANDLAHMANGNPPANIETLLAKAIVSEVYPLAVTILHAKKTVTRLGVCYVSFGASAYASARISHPSHRRRRAYRYPGGRLLTDMASITRAFVGAATFETSIEGTRRPIYDLLMINGPRIATITRAPVKLTDKNFYEMLVVRKHPLILSYFVQIIRGISVEHRTRTRRILSVNETTWAQIDGEPLQIPGRTDITVEHYDQPFNLLSTKLIA